MNPKNHPENREGQLLLLIAILKIKGAKINFLSDSQ
jgi:hypothetical protein